MTWAWAPLNAIGGADCELVKRWIVLDAFTPILEKVCRPAVVIAWPSAILHCRQPSTQQVWISHCRWKLQVIT